MVENYDPLTKQILGCAFKVHTELGPGLLESTYETCLFYELTHEKFQVERQLELPVTYKNMTLDAGYKIDLLVNKKVILEIKSVEKLVKIHEAQLLTYLKLSNVKTGLLLNFNEISLKDGIKRLVI